LLRDVDIGSVRNVLWLIMLWTPNVLYASNLRWESSTLTERCEKEVYKLRTKLVTLLKKQR